MTNLINHTRRLWPLLLLTLAACGTPAPAPAPKAAGPPPAEAPAATLAADAYDQFGAGVKSAEAVTVATVLADPARHTGTLRLSGTVQSVCKKKGCWMRLGPGEQTVFVKFKDYAFFMPKDCEGRTAILEGELAIKEQSVEEVRHYLEDAGKPEEAKQVTAPRKVVTFMASGVALSR